MTTLAPAESQLVEELDYRAGHGIAVWLLWNRKSNAVSVVVADESAGETFSFEVEPTQALDAFNHPFAYTTSRSRCTVTATAVEPLSA